MGSLGCDDREAKTQDWEAYVQAAQVDGVLDDCNAIVDRALRDECLVFRVGQRAEAVGPRQSVVSCNETLDGTSREECVFWIVDSLGLTGGEARSICAEAGGLQRRCRGHAFQREATAILEADSVGGDVWAAHALLEHLAGDYFSRHVGTEEATRRWVVHVVDSVGMNDANAEADTDNTLFESCAQRMNDDVCLALKREWDRRKVVGDVR